MAKGTERAGLPGVIALLPDVTMQSYQSASDCVVEPVGRMAGPRLQQRHAMAFLSP